MKSKLVKIVIVLIVLLAAGIAGYKYLQKGIELKQVRADLDFRSKQDLRIDLAIDVESHYFWETQLRGITYKLRLADQVLLEGREDFDSLMVVGDSSTIPVQLKLNPQEIRSTIEGLQDQDSTSLNFEYTLDYSVPILGKGTKKKDEFKKIPVPVPPQISLDELKVSEMKLGEPLQMTAKVKVVNNGFVDLTLRNLTYNFTVEGDSWAEGKREEPIVVKSRTTDVYDITFNVTPKKVGKRLVQRFIKNDAMQYTLKAEGELDLKMEKLETRNIKFTLSDKY